MVVGNPSSVIYTHMNIYISFLALLLSCGLCSLLPSSFKWQLEIVELHSNSRRDYSVGVYYFSYNENGSLSTRQENNVMYSQWRAALISAPWNVFYGYQGHLYAGTFFLNNGSLVGGPIGSYGPNYWPRDFLSSLCVRLRSNVTLSREFGGNFNDGRVAATEYDCKLMDGAIEPQIYVNESGQLMRFSSKDSSGLWRPQVWDVIEQQDVNVSDSFMRPPDWMIHS